MAKSRDLDVEPLVKARGGPEGELLAKSRSSGREERFLDEGM